MVALANDPAVIDSSLPKLVDTFNAELPPDEQDKRIVLAQESAGGRTWTTLKPAACRSASPGPTMAATWWRLRIAATAERAIATRNGGSALVWSPAFLGQLPRLPEFIRPRLAG